MAAEPDSTLADRGFFHLRAHGDQVVRGRNHREQDHENAAKGQQTLQGGELPLSAPAPGAPPQPVGGQGQQQPCEIEQKFHKPQGESTTNTSPQAVSFSETPNRSQRDLRACVTGKVALRKKPASRHSYVEAAGDLWESKG